MSRSPLWAVMLCACGSGAAAPDAAPDAKVDLCLFSPADAQWVIELETLTLTLDCETGAELNDLQLGPLPQGASFDSETKVLSWTPALDQAAVYQITLSSQSLGADGELVIGVADAYDHPDNQAIVDPTLYTMELGLPVLFIAEEPASSDYQNMEVTYGGTTFQAEAKLRGRSSLSYPKKSYSLRFDKSNNFNESQFADFTNRSRVILTSTFDDNTYVRQRMSYDLWARLQPTIAVRAYNAVVYRGTEYRGIYTISDHINGDLMTRSGLSNKGNLYKAETHDANFRLIDNDDEAKLDLHQGYTKTEGNPEEGEPDAFADLEALVQFVAESDDATFRQEIADRIDIDDYSAWWLHATLLLAYDSAGKNSYHYHDQVRSWRVAPWDFNGSLGQLWDTTRVDSDDNQLFTRRNLLFERLLAHPVHGPAMITRYKEELESGAFELQELLMLYDHHVAETKLSAERDWKRWQAEYNSFPRWSGRPDLRSYQEEVEYTRSWIADRWQFVHDNYL